MFVVYSTWCVFVSEYWSDHKLEGGCSDPQPLLFFTHGDFVTKKLDGLYLQGFMCAVSCTKSLREIIKRGYHVL